MIKTPSAYTIKSGDAFIATQLYEDYYQSYDPVKSTIWSFSANVGFLSRMEIGIRLINYPDIFLTGYK